MPPWDFYPSFRKTLRSLLKPGERRLLAAVSGGPDSMVLWDLLKRFAEQDRVSLTVAHVNHGLRGRAAAADAAFVRRQAEKGGNPCRSVRVPVRSWAERHKRGVEESARVLRYRALERLARKERCPAVLTAHHLDDQVETVFLSLIRGAGPSGLAGMAPQSSWPVPGAAAPRLLRPLLGFSRAEIMNYLRGRRIPFRRDRSNDDETFFRNRLRPVLKEWERLRPGFFARVGRLAGLVRDEEAFWGQHLRKIFRQTGPARSLESRRLIRYHRSVQRRWLRQRFGLTDFNSIERVLDLASSPQKKGELHLPSGRVVKKGQTLTLKRYEKQRP